MTWSWVSPSRDNKASIVKLLVVFQPSKPQGSEIQKRPKMQSLLFPRLSFSRLIHSRSVFPHRVISSRFSHSASELPNRFFSTATPEPTQDVEGDKINEQFLKKMERRYKIRVKPGSDYESRLKVVKSLYEKDETIEATDETAEEAASPETQVETSDEIVEVRCVNFQWTYLLNILLGPSTSAWRRWKRRKKWSECWLWNWHPGPWLELQQSTISMQRTAKRI